MHLIDYINNHSNWMEELASPPYNLKILHDETGCVLLKYNQIESDFNYLLVNEARGCIVRKNVDDVWNYVCRPFTRFYNYGEERAASIDWRYATASEKIDGSYIKCWYDFNLNKWRVSTNGSIDAYKTTANAITGITFGELFDNACIEQRIWFSCGSAEDFTHMFELVSPVSQVVLRYDETKLYYLGSRNNKNGSYAEFDAYKHLMPKKYDAASLEQILKTVSQMGKEHEGVVVFDGVNRIKCKTEEYLRLHHMINNGAQSWERLVKIVLENEQEEFLSYCPEYREQINIIIDRMYNYKFDADILSVMARPLWNDNISRKDWAKAVNHFICPNSIKAYLFKLYDNHELTWDEYCCDWDSTTWVKRLGLKEK